MGYADGDRDWSKPSVVLGLVQLWRGLQAIPAFVQARLRAAAPDQLSLRLVVASLCVSSVLSVFATCVQVYSAYERQKRDTLNVFVHVEQILQRQLEHALWKFDFDQVEVILDALMAHNEISHVAVVSQTGHSWMRGAQNVNSEVGKFELSVTNSNGSKVSVGRMIVHVTLDAVWGRVQAQFWTLLISNMTKAYIGAGIMLIVVHRLFIRHLRQIAAHVSRSKPVDAGHQLRLDRKTRPRQDALDQIVDAFHGHEARVAEYVQKLDQEIAHREDAQRQAEIAAQARTQFLADMSQDIRTPMNSVLGLFQMIKSSEDVPLRHREQADFGHRAAHQLSGQLVNMLDLSRLDSNDIVPREASTEVRSLAADWLAVARAAVHRREKQIEVCLEVDPSLAARYLMDGERVSRIVECLTDNAVKFSDRGCITLELRPVQEAGLCAGEVPGAGLELLVRDCGPVISYEDREVIFQRFTRIEDHLSRKAGGAGLGLALARELAVLMGGTLTVRDCEQAGFNNEFRLSFPNLSIV